MPLSPDDIKKIKLILKLDPKDQKMLTIAHLGTALRRLSVIDPADEKSREQWHMHLTLVHNILDYLEDYQEGLGEINKINSAQKVGPFSSKTDKKGNTALELAINSLLSYALKPNPNPRIAGLQINQRMDLLLRICARSTTENMEAAKSLLAEYASKAYTLDPKFVEIKVLEGKQDLISHSDLCIEAIKFVFQMFINQKILHEMYMKSDLYMLEARRAELTPIILLTSHYEPETAAFFKKYGDELKAAGYNLVGFEIDVSTSPEELMKLDPKARTFLGDMAVDMDPRGIKKLKIFQKVLRTVTEKSMQLASVDIAPELMANIFIVLDVKFGFTDLIAQYRENNMVRLVEALAFESDTKPILLNGLEHYHGLNKICMAYGIKPKFVIVTSDLEDLKQDSAALRVRVPAAELLDASKGPAKAYLVDFNGHPPKSIIEHLGLKKPDTKSKLKFTS